MAVLLDTHVFFWWITGSDRLAKRHRQLIESKKQSILISAVTGWEMALKVKLGKWPDAAALIPELEVAISAEDFEQLPVTLTHAKLAGSLDLAHRDPFDRLLAAQSISLDVPIATVDPAFAQLGAKIV